MNEALLMAPHESALQVRTLDHVTLVVKDLKRSRDFYVDVLGMRADGAAPLLLRGELVPGRQDADPFDSRAPRIGACRESTSPDTCCT